MSQYMGFFCSTFYKKKKKKNSKRKQPGTMLVVVVKTGPISGWCPSHKQLKPGGGRNLEDLGANPGVHGPIIKFRSAKWGGGKGVVVPPPKKIVFSEMRMK